MYEYEIRNGISAKESELFKGVPREILRYARDEYVSGFTGGISRIMRHSGKSKVALKIHKKANQSFLKSPVDRNETLKNESLGI